MIKLVETVNDILKKQENISERGEFIFYIKRYFSDYLIYDDNICKFNEKENVKKILFNIEKLPKLSANIIVYNLIIIMNNGERYNFRNEFLSDDCYVHINQPYICLCSLFDNAYYDLVKKNIIIYALYDFKNYISNDIYNCIENIKNMNENEVHKLSKNIENIINNNL